MVKKTDAVPKVATPPRFPFGPRRDARGDEIINGPNYHARRWRMQLLFGLMGNKGAGVMS
jgi:hypothetical protein